MINRSRTGYLEVLALISICSGLSILFGWRVGLGIFFILYGIGLGLMYNEAKNETIDNDNKEVE